MIDRGGRLIVRCGAEVPGKFPDSLLFLEGGSAFWLGPPLHRYYNHKSRQSALGLELPGMKQGSHSTNHHLQDAKGPTLEWPLPPSKV